MSVKHLFLISITILSISFSASSQNIQWVISGAGNENLILNGEVEYIHSVVTNGQAIYSTAFATGTETTVDGTVIPSSNKWFLLKFELNGDLVWYRELKESFGPSDVVQDPEGNIWVSGSSVEECYLLKYTPAGDLLVDKRIMTTALEPVPYALTSDNDGNIFVCGIYKNSGNNFTEESASFSNMTSSFHGFLIKYNNAGEFQWMNTTNAGGLALFRDVKTDKNGGVIITGDFHTDNADDLLIGDQAIRSTVNPTEQYDSQDALIARYLQNGDLDWVKWLGGTETEYGNKLSVDADDNISFTGTLTNSASFEGQELNGHGEYDAFIVHLDNQGNLLWMTAAGGPKGSNAIGVEAGRSIANDEYKNVYISGSYLETATFGEGPLGTISNSTNKQAGYLAKYSPEGDLIWVKSITGEKSAILDVYIYGRELYFAGNFYPNVTFIGETFPVTKSASMNFFLGAAELPEVITGKDTLVNNKISVYPNPATNTLNILFPANYTEKDIRLFDMKGQLVLVQKSPEPLIHLNIDDLNQGIYTLIISDHNGSYQRRLIKN